MKFRIPRINALPVAAGALFAAIVAIAVSGTGKAETTQSADNCVDGCMVATTCDMTARCTCGCCRSATRP